MDISTLLKLIGNPRMVGLDEVPPPSPIPNTSVESLQQAAPLPQVPEAPQPPVQIAQAPIKKASIPGAPQDSDTGDSAALRDIINNANKAPAALPVPAEAPKLSLEQKLPMLSSPQPDDLAQALEQGRKDQNINNILRAGNAIASGAAQYAGVQPDFSGANAVLGESDKLAGAKATDILTKRKAESDKVSLQKAQQEAAVEKEKGDPTSDVSKLYRSTLKRMGIPNVGEGASASSIEKLFPSLEKYMTAEEARKSRELLARTAAETKKDASVQKQITALKDDLDPNKARGGNLAVNQRKVDQADRLEGLAGAYQGGNLDKRQMEELAIGLNSLLSGSNAPAASQIKALLPSSARGNLNGLIEFMTNNPTGTDQQAFVARMVDSIGREKGIAEAQVKRSQLQRLSSHANLKEASPDDYSAVLGAYGITDEDLKKNPKDLVKESMNAANEAMQAPHGADDAASVARQKRIAELKAKQGIQ